MLFLLFLFRTVEPMTGGSSNTVDSKHLSFLFPKLVYKYWSLTQCLTGKILVSWLFSRCLETISIALRCNSIFYYFHVNSTKKNLRNSTDSELLPVLCLDYHVRHHAHASELATVFVWKSDGK